MIGVGVELQVLESGTEFGGYRIEGLLGRGGMSEDYRASNPRLGNTIAVKLLTREGALPVEIAVSIISQIGAALDCAHEKGLIHRDVKPANILIENNGNATPHVYLSDFGVAKHGSSRSGLTSTGQFVGTVDYIAPEQIEGKALSGATDMYSLACVL